MQVRSLPVCLLQCADVHVLTESVLRPPFYKSYPEHGLVRFPKLF